MDRRDNVMRTVNIQTKLGNNDINIKDLSIKN